MEKEHSAHRLAVDCIYTALVELMQRRPYDEITITDITKRAGVSRMAYYRNFRDKDDILIQRFQALMARAGENMARESPEEYWAGYLQRRRQDPVFEHILKAGLFDKVFDMALDAVRTLYQTVYGLDMTDERRQLFACQKLGALYGTLLYLQKFPGRMSADALARCLAEFMAPDDPSART